MVKGLNTILGEMEGIYNSIDVRVGALRLDARSKWENFVTVIRYSYLSKEETVKNQKKLQAGKFIAQPDKFMIGYKALSIDEPILERYGIEFLRLSDHKKVNYWDHRDPNELLFHYSDNPEFQCDGWGALYGQSEESASGRNDDLTELNSIFHNEKADAMELGFNSIGKALKYMLQTINEIGWHNPMVYYVLPIYGKMTKPYFKNGKVWVDVERHSKLRDFFVNYTRGRPHRFSSWTIDQIAHQERFVMQNDDRSSAFVQERIGLEDYFYGANVLEKVPDELIAVSLVYPRLGGIVIENYEYNRIRELLGTGLPELSNPLLAAFNLFCSNDAFNKMLVEASTFRKTGKEGEIKLTQQKVFERSVAWLLELGGYRTIWLGEKDSGFEHGSADLLAFNVETGRLYVIGCSTRLPKQDEILAIATTTERIDIEVFGEIYPKGGSRDRKVEMIPVYFYASKAEKIITELAKEKGVIAIALGAIKLLYQELKEKRTIQDLKQLENQIYMQGDAI